MWNCVPPITHYSLPITHYPLPITHYLLPIIHPSTHPPIHSSTHPPPSPIPSRASYKLLTVSRRAKISPINPSLAMIVGVCHRLTWF
ncbi:hypothetical protein C7B77_19050 [Chamaesiphon polymorphus CCALA 037]|uniref:Uncharacterized protein n=1 Tax=Chamaesiphon polymorphus CCALA 037 TaxID=2107692 RepID=A0A2T1GA57_9CYAN|nr:hypothetical protein C7B77_19050 [Chamaesiphon polymorphus CCALA 037]